MNQKTFSADFTEKATTNGETSFTAVITTNAIDRDSEVVIPAGMNSKDYERNPVLLYAHDPLKPIGIMRKMRRGESSIDADFVLAPRPEDHEGEWFPDTIGALIKFGALKGVSIGYVPSEGGLRNATKSDSEKYGASVKRVYSKWRLMEVSVVSVPANQDALIMAVSKGLVTRAALLALGCEVKNCGTGSDGFQTGNDCGSGGGGGGGGGSSSKPSASAPSPKLNNTQQAQGKPPAVGLNKPKQHNFLLPRTPGRINIDEFRDSMSAMGYELIGEQRYPGGYKEPAVQTIRDSSGNQADVPLQDLIRTVYANHDDPDVNSINVPVKRTRKEYTVRVTVPSIGRQDVIDAARREVAKMRGHFRA